MKCIAIGDVHGCFFTMLDLLERLKKEIADADKLIFLGDYADRGNFGFEVIDYLYGYQKENPDKVVCLKGNHEDLFVKGARFLLAAPLDYKYYDDYDLWTEYNGGKSTIKSFRANNARLDRFIEWQSNLPLYFETPDFIYAHAGVPKWPLEKNSENDFLWDRENVERKCKSDDAKKVIFGHTADIKPYYTPNGDLCIDTRCVYNNVLTAVVVEADKIIDFYKVRKSDFD